LVDFPKLYTQFAKYYDRLESQYRNHATEAAWLNEILNEAKSEEIIDISCGTGIHIAELSKLSGGLPRRFTAMDASQPMLKEAVKKVTAAGPLSISFLLGDFLNLPFRPTNFDAALCMYWSLAGIDEVQVLDLFQEVNSLLKEGGLFVFDVENSEGIKENLIGNPFVDAFFPDPEDASYIIRTNLSTKIESDLIDWRAYYLVEINGVSTLVTDRMKLRFYSRVQIERLVYEAGFEDLQVLSGPYESYKEHSHTLFFVAKKARSQ